MSPKTAVSRPERRPVGALLGVLAAWLWCGLACVFQGLPAPVQAQTSAGWNGLTPPAQRWSDPAAGTSLARAQQRFMAGEGVLAKPRDPLPLAAGQVLWLAIDLPEVNAARRVVLSLPQPELERATLHWQGDGGQWLSASAGALLPVARWPMPYLHPAFDWTLQAGQSRVYLALEGPQPLVLSWRFWSRERFDDSSRVWHLGLGAFLGFVLLVALMCGVQACLWRDRLPLFFALGALALGGSFLTQWGLTAEYLWPLNPLWAQHAALALPTAAMALLLLFMARLAHDELPPRWGSALWGVVAVGGVLALALGGWGSVFLSLAAQGYDLLVFVLGFALAYRYTRRDWRVGGCLLAGLSALLLGALLPNVRGIGDASWGPLSQQAMQWGGLWALPLMMVALFLRGRQRRDQWVRRRALSRIDALTGVCSERVLIERLDHLILRQHRQHRLGGVMRIRISNLKTIFRASGPQALEAATLHASHCISQVVRRSGDTLARVANGDFVLLLEGEFKPQGVQDLAQMIIARGLAHSNRLPAGTALRLHVTCTAGFYPGCDAQALLNRLGTLLSQMGQGGGRALQLLSPGQLPGVPGSPSGADTPEATPMRWSDPLTLTPAAQRTRMPGLAPGQGEST